MKRLAVVAFVISILSAACGGDGSNSPTAPSPSPSPNSNGSDAGVQTLHFNGTITGVETKLHQFEVAPVPGNARKRTLRAQLRWSSGLNLDLTLLEYHQIPIIKGTQTTATEKVLEAQVMGGLHYLQVDGRGQANTSYTIDVTIQ